MTEFKKIIDKELESMTFNELRNRRSIKMKKNFRIKKVTAVCAAAIAAVVVVGGTVYAVSGRFDEFFSALSRSEISDSTAESGLPSVGGNTADMAEYYDFPEAHFETDGNVSAELLGVYGDSSTLMLSMVITPENGVDISNMSMPFYFTLKNLDGSEKMLGQSGMSGIEKFIPADTDGSYFLTFYLTDPNMAGGRLLIETDGIYTESQIHAAFERIVEYQHQERAQFDSDEEWRSHKKTDWTDTYRIERNFLKDVAPEATGAVSAEIEIPLSTTEPLELNAYGISARLDSLSLYVSDVPDEYKSDRWAGTAHTIYLKDGSIISNESPNYSFPNTEIDLSKFSEYPYVRGTNVNDVNDGIICCFNRPISIDEIEKISVGVINYDADNNIQTTEYVIYGE